MKLHLIPIVVSISLLLSSISIASESIYSGDSDSVEVNNITSTNGIPVPIWSDPNSVPMPFSDVDVLSGPTSFSIEYRSDSPYSEMVYVLVESGLYPWVVQSMDLYVEDLESIGYQVTLFNGSWTTADDVRTLFQNGLGEGLCGAVLIGDIVSPWYEMDDEWGHEEFPIDLYYMDLDGTWTDMDFDGMFDVRSGELTPEIWVGRLMPSGLGSEVTLLENYMRKNHDYRVGDLSLPESALVYIDDDWAPWATSWSSSVGLVYENRTTVSDGATTIDTDYENRLTQEYEWVELAAHSWASGHSFKIGTEWTGGSTSTAEIESIDPKALFYNLFCCSGTRYVETNNIGSQYIFTDTHGICAVGSTKTGSMLNFDEFYRPLGQDKSIGEAFKEWFTMWGESDPKWFYGMVILGDPTLTTTHDVTAMSPLVTSPTHPDSEEWYALDDPTFQWEEPGDQSGISGYYYILDKDNDTVPTATTGMWTADNGVDFSDQVDGEWYFHIVSLDTLGNIGTFPSHYSLNIDTQAPNGSLLIDGGSTYTNSTNVTLSMVTEDLSGVVEMRFGDDGNFRSSWVAFEPSGNYSLPAVDGNRSVHVQFKDAAGTVSDGNISDHIILDMTSPTGTLSINNGSSHTITTLITLDLNGSDANPVKKMRLSEDGSAWGMWEDYSGSRDYSLPIGDGVKSMFIQFMDAANLVSMEPITDSIILDTIAPTGSVMINEGENLTTTTSVQLGIEGNDTNDILRMRLKNAGDSWEPWQAFTALYNHTLEPGDGTKTVYLELEDAAGLVSSGVIKDDIILDTTPPNGTLVINGDDTFTTSFSVSLALEGDDENEVVGMRFSLDQIIWSAWEDYDGDATMNLTEGDGSRSVFVQYMDGAGLVSNTPISDEIILDTTPPNGTISINDGDEFTTSMWVFLNLSGKDDNGITHMRINKDDSSWSDWEPYMVSKNTSIPSGDGVREVKVEFKDSAGMISFEIISDTIILDTTPPNGTIVINQDTSETESREVTLTLNGTDANDVVRMRFSEDGETWGPWENYSGSWSYELGPGDGEKNVYVQFEDGASLISTEAIFDTIVLSSPEDDGLEEGGGAGDGDDGGLFGLDDTSATFLLIIIIVMIVALITVLGIHLSRKRKRPTEERYEKEDYPDDYGDYEPEEEYYEEPLTKAEVGSIGGVIWEDDDEWEEEDDPEPPRKIRKRRVRKTSRAKELDGVEWEDD